MARRDHNLTLELLRGIAALAAVSQHMGQRDGFATFPSRGYLVVDYFFLISGFFVAQAYENRLRNDLEVLEYVKIRLIRLYPLLLLGMVLGFLINLSGFDYAGAGGSPAARFQQLGIALAAGLFLLPFNSIDPAGGHLFPLDGPIWSLMFELWINFFHGRFVRYLSNRRVVMIIAGSFIGILLAAYIYGDIDGGNMTDKLWIGFARVGFSFFLGVLIFRLHGGYRSMRSFSAPAPVIGAVFCTLLLVPKPWFGGGAYDVCFVALFNPLILVLAVNSKMPEALKGIASYLGKTAYPIYILHMPLFINFSFLQNFHGTLLLLGRLGCLVVIVALSNSVFEQIDNPVRSWLSKKILTHREQ